MRLGVFPLCAMLTCCSAAGDEVLPPIAPIEIEGGAIATNYKSGVGFFVGANDPAPLESATITDASQLIFANERTDPFTYNASSEELQHLLAMARTRVGQEIQLRFLSSYDQPERRLSLGANTIQFIVNQY